MSRRLFGVLLLVLVAMTLAVRSEPLRVSLDFFANPNHVPLYVAESLGYFDEVGIEVEIFVPANPSDPVKLAAAQSVEVALTPQINYLIARSEDLPLIAFGALIDHALGGLLALAEHGVAAIKDLAGQHVGYSLSPLEPVLWTTVFACAEVEDYELVNVGFSTVASLLAGSVRAIGAFRNYEPFEIERLGYTPVFFSQEDFCIPATYEIIFVSHPAFVSDRSEEAAAFVDAVSRAIAWTVENPEAALALFFERFPELDDEVNRKSYDATLPLFALGARHDDPDVWESMQAYLLETELMARIFALEELYTERFLPIE